MFSSKVATWFTIALICDIILFVNYGFWAGVLGIVIGCASSGVGVLSLLAKANGEIR